jgi:hypothetical protein
MSTGRSKKLVGVPKDGCTKNHQIPKDVVAIVKKLRNLEFVACVNTSSFKPSSKKNGIEVIGYDDIKKTYNVKVNVPGFEQRLHVRPKDGERKCHKKAIENAFYQDLSKTL